MRLPVSSCEQEASPSLSIGCRQITSLSRVQMTCLSVEIVTICLPTFSELHYWAPLGDEFLSLSFPAFSLSRNLACSCPTPRLVSVLYPADALRTERTHPVHILAAAGFSMCTMAGPSNTTTSTLGVMSSCSSMEPSRHRTMSDLVPSLSSPLSDSVGGHGWFS